ALRKALIQTRVELSCRHWHQDATLYVESHHTVVEHVALTLGNHFGLPVLRHEHGQLLQMGADKVPNASLSSCCQLEPFFKAIIRLVSRDDQVLLSCGTGDLPVRTLFLVHRANVSDHEAGR